MNKHIYATDVTMVQVSLSSLPPFQLFAADLSDGGPLLAAGDRLIAMTFQILLQRFFPEVHHSFR